MAAANSDSSVKCSILSLPSAYFLSMPNFECVQKTDKTVFGLGSNTIIINEKTSNKLGLSPKSTMNIMWAVLKVNLNLHHIAVEKHCFISKRLMQIVVDRQVPDSTVVISEDLLYNLVNSEDRSNNSIIKVNKPYLVLSNECLCDTLVPAKAIKANISVFQSQSSLEECFIDKILQNYFSHPRYLCKGDVFSVHINEPYLSLFNNVTVDTIYFKVCELQGSSTNNSQQADVLQGYCADSSVTIYQVSNYQGFLPSRKTSVLLRPNLSSVLSNDKIVKRLVLHSQSLMPPSFDSIFNTLSHWVEIFLSRSKRIEDIELNPVFLLCGQNGAGKALLLHALSKYYGLHYWRIDCVSLGGAIASQVESKLKGIFNQLKTLAPCILHLSNIQCLGQDADSKEDIRIISCFEQQVKMMKFKWPVIIVATTQSIKHISSNIHHLFLETATVNSPDSEQREDIISWLVQCNNGLIDTHILQTVATQTAGFVFRDLQTLVALAFKEKYKRTKDENGNSVDFVLSDFTKVIGIMHKAYSESIGAPKVPSVSWKDVGGLESLKKEILRSLRSNMFNTGLRRSGLLLHGPPGTGKTLLAKAVATQCGRNFLSVKGPELLNMYVGQSEHNVRDLFELAKTASPCIIFFDELDSLAPNRGRSGDSGGVMDRVVSQLLAEMDDIGNSNDVFILGATNRPDLIDPALLRPGRLDKQLYVGPCEDRSSQLSVITALTHKLCLHSDVDLQEIVSQLPKSVSGAQLAALCSAAWLSSARQTIQSGSHKLKPTVTVSQNDFLSVVSSVFS